MNLLVCDTCGWKWRTFQRVHSMKCLECGPGMLVLQTEPTETELNDGSPRED